MAWRFADYPENWDEIREGVFERDGYTCRQCGAEGKQIEGDAILHCHHDESRSDDYDNLVTLCEECHITQPGHERMLNNPDTRQRHLQRIQKKRLANVIREILGEM